MKKKVALLLAFVLLIVTVSACKKEAAATPSPAPSEPAAANAGEYVGFNGVPSDIDAEITIYRHYAGADKINMDNAVAKMVAKYPGLKINIEHRSDSDGTALKTWAAVGELPDIFENTAADAFNSLRENGDMYPLDDAIKATGVYDLFTNGAVSQAGHTNADGHQYSMSAEVNHVLCFWYNKSLFAELGLTEPTNYEEFKHCITVLKDAGKIPIALFGAEQWPAVAIYSLAAVAEGQPEGVDAVNFGRAKFSDDAFVRAAEKFKEIVDLGAFGDGALSTNYQQAGELMSTGQAGFFVSGSWYWLDTETGGFADNVDWCNYNVFADADVAEAVKGHAVGGKIKEQTHSVNANPPSGLDPYTVALLLCEFEYNIRLDSAESGNMTTVKGDFNFTGGEAYSDFNDTYGNFTSFNTLPGDMANAELVTYLGNGVEMLVSGNYTAQEFLEEMAASGF